MRLSLSAALIVVLTIVSCKKDKTHPISPAPVVTDTSAVHINYIYLASTFQIQLYGVNQFELILSTGDSVLLDTIAAVNIPLTVDIKRLSSLVDMSVITYRTNISAYSVYSEKAITPGNWSVLPGSDSTLGLPLVTLPTYTPAYLHYINVPAPASEPYFFSNSNANYQSGIVNGALNGDLPILFDDYPDFDVWLSFPNKGLYNFHHMSTASVDTVDLSSMDTAVRFTITPPAGYTNTETLVNGFPDSTNTLRNIFVSANAPVYNIITGADVVYPGYKKVFQKYQFTYSAADGAGDQTYYSDIWADSITPTPFLIDNTFFNLLSSTNNNFSVQFTRQVPGFYTLTYSGAQVALIINLPGDSTTFQPVNFLTALNSKWLKNIALTSIRPGSFAFGYPIIQGHPESTPLAPLTNQYEDRSHDVPISSFLKTF